MADFFTDLMNEPTPGTAQLLTAHTPDTGSTWGFISGNASSNDVFSVNNGAAYISATGSGNNGAYMYNNASAGGTDLDHEVQLHVRCYTLLGQIGLWLRRYNRAYIDLPTMTWQYDDVFSNFTPQTYVDAGRFAAGSGGADSYNDYTITGRIFGQFGNSEMWIDVGGTVPFVAKVISPNPIGNMQVAGIFGKGAVSGTVGGRTGMHILDAAGRPITSTAVGFRVVGPTKCWIGTITPPDWATRGNIQGPIEVQLLDSNGRPGAKLGSTFTASFTDDASGTITSVSIPAGSSRGVIQYTPAGTTGPRTVRSTANNQGWTQATWTTGAKAKGIVIVGNSKTDSHQNATANYQAYSNTLVWTFGVDAVLKNCAIHVHAYAGYTIDLTTPSLTTIAVSEIDPAYTGVPAANKWLACDEVGNQIANANPTSPSAASINTSYETWFANRQSGASGFTQWLACTATDRSGSLAKLNNTQDTNGFNTRKRAVSALQRTKVGTLYKGLADFEVVPQLTWTASTTMFLDGTHETNPGGGRYRVEAFVAMAIPLVADATGGQSFRGSIRNGDSL